MFNKINSLHIAIAVIIFLLVALNWKSLKAAATGSEKTPGTNDLPDWLDKIINGNKTAPAPVSGKLDCGKVLKKGSTGPEVQQLQTWILMADPKALPTYNADGDFGQETLSALQKLTGQSAITLNQAVLLINKFIKQAGGNFEIKGIC